MEILTTDSYKVTHDKEYSHECVRTWFKWGTYGKNGDEPLKHILVQDIGDEHLTKIIEHIKSNSNSFDPKVLKVMESEVEYRIQNTFIKIK